MAVALNRVANEEVVSMVVNDAVRIVADEVVEVVGWVSEYAAE